MATRSIISSSDRYGASYIFSQTGGLYKALGRVRVGELFLNEADATVASGAFGTTYDNAPFVQFTPTADPSGAFYISNVTTTHVYVTFENSPAGDDKTFPYKVGNWMTIL